eukprot:jgi/Galph1/4731/GphlegSOOS_G3369.1
MKLDATSIKSLSNLEFRVLAAVEMGMKNHELVPVELISSISKLKPGGFRKGLQQVLFNKLVHHEQKGYDAYRLTYVGYDFLALNAFVRRGLISSVGDKVGVGKESDVFIAQNSAGEKLILKFHRLGRTSFRAVKEKRDYLKHRKSASWLYLSRLAAHIEFRCMKALYEAGFPVPKPLDVNRHCVCMQYIENSVPLVRIRELSNPQIVYTHCLMILERLLNLGLVHGDFNQFNILINEAEEVFVIDFPQMTLISHPTAQKCFENDLSSLELFFLSKFGVEAPDSPKLSFEEIRRKHENKELFPILDLDVESNDYELDIRNDTLGEVSVHSDEESFPLKKTSENESSSTEPMSSIARKVKLERKASEGSSKKIYSNMKQFRKARQEINAVNKFF